jgi:hypothetical protein
MLGLHIVFVTLHGWFNYDEYRARQIELVTLNTIFSGSMCSYHRNLKFEQPKGSVVILMDQGAWYWVRGRS